MDESQFSKVNANHTCEISEKTSNDDGTRQTPAMAQSDKSDSNNNGEDPVKGCETAEVKKEEAMRGPLGLDLPEMAKDDDTLLDRVMCGGMNGMFQCMFCGLQFASADLLEEHETVVHSESPHSNFNTLPNTTGKSSPQATLLAGAPESGVHPEDLMKNHEIIPNFGDTLQRAYQTTQIGQSGNNFNPEQLPPAYPSQALDAVHGNHDHRGECQPHFNASVSCSVCPLVFSSLALREQHMLEHADPGPLALSANMSADTNRWAVEGQTLTQLEPMSNFSSRAPNAMADECMSLQATAAVNSLQAEDIHARGIHQAPASNNSSEGCPGLERGSSIKGHNQLGTNGKPQPSQHVEKGLAAVKLKPREQRQRGEKRQYSSSESSWVDDESSGASGNSSCEADSEEKQFKCEVCDKKFKYHASWNVHKRIHTKEKPLHCKVCPKRFGDPANFIRHLKIHVKHGEMCIGEDGTYIPVDPNNRPSEPTFEFGAEECFALSFNFNYSCPHCSMGFMMEESLKAHTERCSVDSAAPATANSASRHKDNKKQKKRGRPRNSQRSSSQGEGQAQTAPASSSDVLDILTPQHDTQEAKQPRQTHSMSQTDRPHISAQRRGRGRPRKNTASAQHEQISHPVPYFNQNMGNDFQNEKMGPSMSHQSSVKAAEHQFSIQNRNVAKDIGTFPHVPQPQQFQPPPSQQRVPLQPIPTPISPRNQHDIQYQQQAQVQLPQGQQQINSQTTPQLSTSSLPPKPFGSYNTTMASQSVDTNHRAPLPSVGVFSTNIGNIRQKAPAISFSEVSLDCAMCDAIFKNSDALMMHENMHVNNQTVMCKYCGSKFSFLSSMKDHVQNEHHRNTNKVPRRCVDTTDKTRTTGQKRRGRPPKQRAIEKTSRVTRTDLSNTMNNRKRKVSSKFKIPLSSEEDSPIEEDNQKDSGSEDSLSDCYTHSENASDDEVPSIPIGQGASQRTSRVNKKKKKLNLKRSTIEQTSHQLDPVTFTEDLMKDCVVTLDDIDSVLSGGRLSVDDKAQKRKRVPRTATRNKEPSGTKTVSKEKAKPAYAPKKYPKKSSFEVSESDEDSDNTMKIHNPTGHQGKLTNAKQKSILTFFGKKGPTTKAKQVRDGDSSGGATSYQHQPVSSSGQSPSDEHRVPFSCQVCGAQFKMPRLLRKHETSEHPGRPVTSVAQLEQQMKAWCQRRPSQT